MNENLFFIELFGILFFSITIIGLSISLLLISDLSRRLDNE